MFWHLAAAGGAALAVQASAALALPRAVETVHLLSPVYGVAIGAVLAGGWAYLPAVLLGAALSSVSAGDPTVYTVLLTLATALSAALTRGSLHLLRTDLRMERLADAVKVVAVATGLAPAVAAGVELVGIVLGAPGLGWEAARAHFSSIWLAASMGSLVVAPFVVVWSRRLTWEISTRQGVEILGWLLLLLAFGWVTFKNWAPTDTLFYPMELAIFPIMAWAAIRFGLRGVTAGVVALSIVAYWQLMAVLGPEKQEITQSPANLWIFVGILALTSLLLAAVMAELRRRELLVAENESRLRAFTNALPDIAFVLARDGTVREVFASGMVNETKHAIVSAADARGRNLAELFPERTVQRFRETITTALRFSNLQTLEYSLDAPDRGTFWFEARVMPMEAAGGARDCVVWVAYDITSRKESEAALKHRDEILRATAKAKNLLLTTMDFGEAMEGALRLVGDALRADRAFLFEISRTPGEDKHSVSCRFEWRRADDLPSFKSSGSFRHAPLEERFPGWYRHFAGHGVIRGEVASLNPAFRPQLEAMRCRSLLVVPVWVDRALWGFFGVDVTGDARQWQGSELNALRVMSSSMSGLILTRDREIALRRERDRADAASTAKGEFLAMMSHEIRTPMNAIVGYSDLLAQSELDDNQREQVGIVKRSGKALLELINNILDYSKIESRSLELEVTCFDLEQIVCEALEGVLVGAREKGVRLDFHIEETLSHEYEGDPYRLRQILTNLLSNAVKFTREGTVDLRVERIGETPADGIEDLHFRVVDTGVGIPKEKFDRLFQAFSQVDSSTTREFGGTGLGLAIARRLVERMDGRIWAESEPGRGSTFHFTIRCRLPGAKAGKARRHGAPVAEDDMDPAFGKRCPLRLLVCEDDRDNQWVIREILESLGYAPEIVGDGGEAQLRLRYRSYDAVLMDVQMPEIDGIELSRRLRRGDLGEDRRDQYVIAFTAFAMNEDRERCLSAGMNDYLSKPLSVARLKEALARAHEACPDQAPAGGVVPEA